MHQVSKKTKSESSQNRFQIWGHFLKTWRLKKFRSAREFCSVASLGVSYPQYSRFESGEQLPTLEQVWTFCQPLEAPFLEAWLKWCEAQIVSEEPKKMFQTWKQFLKQFQAEKSPPEDPSQKWVEGILENVGILDHQYKDLFMQDPRYRDVLAYVNCASYFRKISFQELEKVFSISKKELTYILKVLAQAGWIFIEGECCRGTKTSFYLPEDEAFFSLRNKNVIYNTQALMQKITLEDIQQKRAYRTVLTRELTIAQRKILIDQIHTLYQKVMELKPDPNPTGIYSLCVLFGERFPIQNLSLKQKRS